MTLYLDLSALQSVPVELPLPRQGTTLVGRAAELCRMVDRISAAPAAAGGTGTVWDRALGHVQEIAV
ncbi:hypothetical protein ACFUTR_33395 [Streptomyces sp. NPDC057367]|uniref:hypothetical protein n=1 Tax=Streptomyces sp. NPDC057367 TaxID=3346108 RepID=UPI003626CDEF